MSYYNQIEKKLKDFYRKYYKNRLIKGTLLFLTFGLTYFLLTSFIEFSLWLSPLGRTFLFWLFVLVELYLLFQFVGKPTLKLFQTQKGINDIKLSKIVGKHFKEIEDKLLNVLQLKEHSEESDLLLASIEQKAKEIAPIQFNKAIDYKLNLKYLKYALIPLSAVLILFLTNIISGFSKSFDRVVNYQTSYTPPAPFRFVLKKKNLKAIQGEDYTLQVITEGNITPSEAKIYFNNQEYYLNSRRLGEFEFTFEQVQDNIEFFIQGNEVKSQTYSLDVVNTPKIKGVNLDLQYPKHTKQKNERLNSPSNLIVPEGTEISWSVTTVNTDSVDVLIKGEKTPFIKNKNNEFIYKKRAKASFNYQISSSNKQIKNYDNIGFFVNVVKDEFPKINVQTNLDSLNNQPIYFVGQISDDYGLKKLQLVYSEEGDNQKLSSYKIPIKRKALESFYYDFPSGLNLKEGIGYEFYFEVFDNDGVNGSKKTQSKTFYYRLKTKEELNQKQLDDQKNYINNLEKSLLNKKKEKSALEDIQKDLQNKQNMNWNDKKKIENLIKRQKQYQQMMDKQTKNLLENFDKKKEENESLQNTKEELKKRIEELKKLKRQQKLLEELEKLTNKLDKDELVRKTKELAEQNKQQERSLERILELTKRFYVEQKMTQLANKLDKLSKEQNKLSNKENPTKKEQEELNKKFQKTAKELEELDKDNQKLKKPMDLPDVSDEKYDVNKQQKEAKENLDKQNKSAAKKNQKKAAKKMQQMSQKMQQAMSDMQANAVEANIEGLRKILKNLITFSFQQEGLMKKFEEIDFQHPDFGSSLRKQNVIKTYFEHIDDSLYVLSMRVPQISAKIQNDLANAHYNLNQSLENFTERRFSTGTSNQQYVMTSANNLSDFLSDLLNNMNNSMSGKGKGKPKNSFSLPDILKKQEGLSKKMKEGLGKKKKQGNQQKGKEKGNKEGEENNGELYKIYQQQSQLRDQLQNLIKNGNDPKGQGKKVVKSMEQLENEILEKGFSREVLQRMQNLEYQMLKLDKAVLEQNKDKKRKSNTNTRRFSKQQLDQINFKKLFTNQLEILNRQSLPLQQNYKRKVQEYFSKTKKD